MDWKGAFHIIDDVLGKINEAASIPGVNLIPYVATVGSAASVLRAGLEAGVDIADRALKVKEVFDKPGLPSKADLDALDAELEALEAEIDAPLPPKEEGEG